MEFLQRKLNQSSARSDLLSIVRWSLTVGLLTILAACFPSPPEDDESHASFAREAIPTILGRRATGVDEVEVVADIAELLGRDAAVQMLMEDPAYVDHWADAMLDILKVQRHALNDGVNAAQDQTCWGPPTTDNPDPQFAEWVRDHGPTDAGAPTGWNMTDLLRSAILIDDLSVIYKAYLFPLAMRRDGSGGRNAQLAERLSTVYLNRDTTCLRCHNPTFSTSNLTDGSGNVVWQRLHNINGHPEKALFNNYYDSVGAFDNLTPVMRGTVRQPVAGGVGILPWGMNLACATDTDQAGAANNGTLIYTGFRSVSGGGNSVAFGSLDGSVDPDVSLWELERSLDQGVTDLQDGYERFTATSVVLPPDEEAYCEAVDVFASNCTGCHSGGSPSGNLDLSTDPHGELVGVASQAGSSVQATRVVANNTGGSELWSRVSSGTAGYQMPPGGGLSAADESAIEGWINSGAVGVDLANCNTSPIPDVAPDEAFAFLTAANAVDGIWDSVMGYRLTIDHGFPRNKAQRDMLWNLTEYTFLPEDWSLKSVLSKILSSDWFARRAPSLSQLDSAYPMQPILDPWIVANPVDVPNPHASEKHNGKGEQVNRYRVNTLLRSIADALGWEQPRRFRDASYPTTVDEQLGQYRSPTIAGFDDVNFQSLLALEAEVGLCNKTGKAVDSDDYIDLLVDAITQFNSDNPDTPITIGDAYSILKDRLLQDTTIEAVLPPELRSVPDALSEASAIVALFTAGTGSTLTLNSSATDLSTTQLDTKLRESCGSLVKTPQFLLANITPGGYSDNNMPDAPRLTVCLDGEECGYPQACGHWRSTLWSMGTYLACEDRTVRRAQLVYLPLPDDFVFYPREPGIFTPIREPRFDLAVSASDESTMKKDRASLPKAKLKQADFDLQFTLRSATLCPEGLCGFVKKPSVDQCVNDPSAASCRRLVATCDPRDTADINQCGRRRGDIRDSGIHVLWGDGAKVTHANGVMLLRPELPDPKSIREFAAIDTRKTQSKPLNVKQTKALKYDPKQPLERKPVGSRLSSRDLTKLQRKPIGPFSERDLKWRELEAGETLRAGDLVHVPLTARLTLEHRGNRFGTGKPIKQRVEGRRNSGHVLSITGSDISRLLATPTKRGALSPAQLRKAELSGEFQSRAPTKREWARLERLSTKPQSYYVPSTKELYQETQAYEEQHILEHPSLTPEGTDKVSRDDKP